MIGYDPEGTCPNGCKLVGEEIPTAYLEAGHYGKWDGVTKAYYGRVIGIEDPRIYDGINEWLCPDCGIRWPRTGHRP